MLDAIIIYSEGLIPLAKCKTSELLDENNCRAIIISTSLLNCLRAYCQFMLSQMIAHQFGFTAGYCTSLCNSVFKRRCKNVQIKIKDVKNAKKHDKNKRDSCTRPGQIV